MPLHAHNTLFDNRGLGIGSDVTSEEVDLAWPDGGFVTDDATGAVLHGFSATSAITGFNDINVDTGVDGGGAGRVPEPASWALTIGGLGLMGTVLRRRRSAALAT